MFLNYQTYLLFPFTKWHVIKSLKIYKNLLILYINIENQNSDVCLINNSAERDRFYPHMIIYVDILLINDLLFHRLILWDSIIYIFKKNG